ncbi:MAG: glycosyltransferase family 39 protein [Actinomycetota bacterium]|nr:glycosyltransferase family 39 protein [Actinomycetota bacterium]MDQ2980764.1 glycosyltransferase family 39 protein [Actinomycetota bacterium]
MPVAVWLTALVLVSAAIRFAFALQDPAPFIFQDELLYSELAKGFAATGHFALREAPTLGGVAPLYPVLISPAYALFDNLPHAYAAAKAINALLMSLTAVPVYLVARRLVRPAMAFLAAALALAMPWLVYTSMIMTENAFYPVFLFWFLALVLTLERPTIPRQLATLALLGGAYEVRPQAVALLPALVTAIVLATGLEAWLGSERNRRRALFVRLRSFWPTWAAVAIGALLFFLVEIVVRGHSVNASLLHGYAPLGSVDYLPGAVARWFLWHVAELDFATGVIPFAAFVALVLAAARRGESTPAVRAFAGAGLATTFWLFIEVGAFASSPYSQRIQERNLFYLVPIFLVALVAWAGEGVGRSPKLTAIGGLVAAALVGIVPYPSFLNSNTANDSFGLLPLMRLQQHFTIASDRLAIGIVLTAIAAAAIFILLPRRYAVVAPVLVLAYFAYANRGVEGFTSQAARDSRNGGVQVRRDWVDHTVGADAQVAALFTNNRNYVSLWDNEFFNRSIGPVYNFIGPPDGLPQQTVTPDPKTGTLTVAGTAVRSHYVLADTSLLLPVRPVATDPGVGMALYRVDGPIRLTGRLGGIYSDAWSGSRVSYTGYDCHGGHLTVRLTGDPDLQPRPQTIVARSGTRVLGRIVVRPRHFHVPFTIPLVGKDGTCDVTYSISPTAVPADVLGRPDTRELGIRFESVAYRRS